jgi:hypothetical protein
VGFDCVDQGHRFAVAANTPRPSRLSEPMHTGLLNCQKWASIVEKGVETVKLDSSWPGMGFERTDWMPRRSLLIGVGERGYSTESEDSGFGL